MRAPPTFPHHLSRVTAQTSELDVAPPTFSHHLSRVTVQTSGLAKAPLTFSHHLSRVTCHSTSDSPSHFPPTTYPGSHVTVQTSGLATDRQNPTNSHHFGCILLHPTSLCMQPCCLYILHCACSHAVWARQRDKTQLFWLTWHVAMLSEWRAWTHTFTKPKTLNVAGFL